MEREDGKERGDGQNPGGLDWSTKAQDLITSHNFVVQYYDGPNSRMATCYDFRMGRHFTPDELLIYQRKKKTPVAINKVKPNERAAVGSFIQQLFDVEFAPFEPNDQSISDVLKQLDSWNSEQQGDTIKDVDIFRMAYVGGRAYQECWMEVIPGRKARMHTDNQNTFAVYWDPDSRRRIIRDDARFVDRDSYASIMDLCNKFEDKAYEIKQALNPIVKIGSSYEVIDVYKDRTHETMLEKNGLFRVTERFYKTREKVSFAMVNGRRVDLEAKQVPAFKSMYPNLKVFSEWMEVLNLGIVCPSFSQDKYLFNDRYHCQPRNPDPDNPYIIFPILEFVAENMNGEDSGYIEDQIAPNKILDSMVSNILHAAKHASTEGKLVDEKAFKDETQLKLFEKYWSDGDRSFRVKEGRTKDAVGNIPKGEVSQSNVQMLEFASVVQEELSSTPKSTKGLNEGSVAGVLNQQRIDQSLVQMLATYTNWKAFLRQRLILRYYYWRTYWDHEQAVRVIEKTGDQKQDWIWINKQVPEYDQHGYPTGKMSLWNDINSAIYDVKIVDSKFSPTQRDRLLQILGQILQNPNIAKDPVLGPILSLELVRLTDMSQDAKDLIKNYSSTAQQLRMQKEQAELQRTQADTASAMQGVAQAEAEQTFLPELPDWGASASSYRPGMETRTRQPQGSTLAYT